MPLEVLTGAPFSGKNWWAEQQIERRESDGERGLLLLSYTGIYSALAPGDESTFRDDEVSDSGTPRLAGWLLAGAIREAAQRELSGYVAVDSPRRALQYLEITGGNVVIEATVTEGQAIRRAREHVSLISELAPRAKQKENAEAIARCQSMISTYFREREAELAGVEVRKVRAPTVPPVRAITQAYRAAMKARRRGDTEAVRKWLTAAKAWSIAHELPGAKGIIIP